MSFRLLMFLFVLVLFSCSKHEVKPADPDVYLVGYMNASNPLNGTKGVYWKNGVETDLDQSYGAYDVFVSGTDVHLIGIGSNGAHNFPIYWKNGVATNLTDGSFNAYAYGITISGDDVYIAGLVADSSGYGRAVYWKNGVVNHLSSGASANSVAVSGNDVYVTGVNYSNGGVYWKNGTVNKLPGCDGAFEIAISGTDVYVTGMSKTPTGIAVATYWKNSVLTTLSDGTVNSGISGISVTVSDVHVAGWENNNNVYSAVYWKNGVKTILESDALTTGIQVFSSDVYISGQISGGSNARAAYWKNGVVTKVSDGNFGTTEGLFVK